MNIHSETKSKIFSTIIGTVATFLGFEALSYVVGIYQLPGALRIALWISLFHIFWMTFLFDLHLKKRGVWENNFTQALKERFEHLRHWPYVRHYINYLVLPAIIYWMTVALFIINPFRDQFKQIILLASTLALSVSYWYLKEHVSRKLEHQDHWIRVLSLVKLYAAFLIYSGILGLTFYFGFDATFLFSSVFALTLILIYQILFQHGLLNFRSLLLVVLIATVMGTLSIWVYTNWNSEYFSAALVMLAIYNSLWGLLHHKLERNLTKKIALEYLAMMILIVSILLAGHNFSQRIN